MAVSIIETIKSRANSSNTAYIAVVKLLCDDYSDLPAQSGLSGYELAQGCTAHVINENKDYMIDSSGNWHVYGGDSWTNVYTKSETDALLDDKQNELTTAQLDAVNSGITAAKLTADEAALAELVDSGAKNIVHTQDITRQGKGYIATPNGDGTYTITGSRTDAGSVWLEIADVSAEAGSYMLSGGVIGIPVAISAGGSVVYAGITAQEINAEISNKLYIHIMAEFNQSNINYVIKPMICTAVDWAISQKFVPYAPTNRELYETCETKVTMQQAYGDAILIPANSDLNNYTTPGLYYALVADVPTITNTPYNATGLRLVVEKNTPSGAAVFQTIYPTSRTHLEFYRRIYEGGSWSSWYKFTGTAVT